MYPTFTAAALAGATSCLTLHPLEVLRSRLTCDNQGRYRGLVSSTQQIVRSEGMAALYRGLGPALLAILPEAAITYGRLTFLLHPCPASPTLLHIVRLVVVLTRVARSRCRNQHAP